MERIVLCVLMASGVVVAACSRVCPAPPQATSQAATATRRNQDAKPSITLTVGGVFWRRATPGYATESSTSPMITIPKYAICDVRVHPGSSEHKRARVKVLVNGNWRLVWVNRVHGWPSTIQATLSFLPFDTFGYCTHGTEKNPNLDWQLTKADLMNEAHQWIKEEMSETDLIALYGSDLVNEQARHPGPTKL
ncbi:MAG: hypothetical protein ACLQVA_16555 [Candidatus Brocadiia bacterium]